MAVPRNRHSSARKKKKRSHLAKKPKNLALCSACASQKLPHRMCAKCGFYKKEKNVS